MENTQQNKTGTNLEIVPYKEATFELYCLWKSLPAFFRFPPKDRKTGLAPTPEQYLEIMGVDDERIIELIHIKTQGQFCIEYNVSKNTLTSWNELAKKRTALEDIRLWAQSLTKNVTMGLYNATIRGGLPQHYLAWFKLVEGWVEKAEVEHNYKGVTKISYQIVDDNGDTNQPENKPEAVASPSNTDGQGN